MKKLILILLLFVSAYANAQVVKGYRVESRTEIRLDTSYNETGDEPIGSRFWNPDDNTTSLVLPNGVVLQDGHELFFDVVNQTGGDLINGYAAAYGGALGASAKIKAKYGIADGSNIPENVIGIFTETIANGENGKVTWFGKVRGIQTDGANFGETWADGDTLWVSPFTAGYLTNIQPNTPYQAINMAIVADAKANNGTLIVRPTFPKSLVNLTDVNGTPVTITGQFPVWDNDESYFDFNYRVSDDVYSSDWDGKDTVVPTFNNIYDKLNQFESVNYCTDSAVVNFGTIESGSQDSLCEIDNQNLTIAERPQNPPFQVDFLFQNVERLQYFSFYGDYIGGQTHQVHVYAYNYVSTSWDFIGEFGTSASKRWYSFPIFLPNNHINGSDEVLIRVEHQGSGIASHRMIFDYVEVNFGGTGGGNFIDASSVDFMAYDFVTSGNVQGGMQQIIDSVNDASTQIGLNSDHRVSDLDIDPTNELQTITSTDGSVTVTPSGNDYDLSVDITSGGGASFLDTITQTLHGFSVGNVIAHNDIQYILAKADTAITADATGIIKEVIDVNTFVIQFGGVYTEGTWTVGENYFLSTDVAGLAVIDTQSYTNNEVYLFIGTGVSDGLLIEIDVGFLISEDTTAPVVLDGFYYEDELTDSETVIDVGFSLSTSTLVFVNGAALSTNDWSYSGTSVTLNMGILASDLLIVKTGEPEIQYYDEFEVVSTETQFTSSFTLTNTTLLTLNGAAVSQNEWSGEGTTTLDVTFPTAQYDLIIIKN